MAEIFGLRCEGRGTRLSLKQPPSQIAVTENDNRRKPQSSGTTVTTNYPDDGQFAGWESHPGAGDDWIRRKFDNLTSLFVKMTISFTHDFEDLAIEKLRSLPKTEGFRDRQSLPLNTNHFTPKVYESIEKSAAWLVSFGTALAYYHHCDNKRLSSLGCRDSVKPAKTSKGREPCSYLLEKQQKQSKSATTL